MAAILSRPQCVKEEMDQFTDRVDAMITVGIKKNYGIDLLLLRYTNLVTERASL